MDLQSILQLKDLRLYKFHAARYNEEYEPLDVFLRDRSEWDSWNSWQGSKNEFNRDYVISFIKFYPEQKTWLFGGVYKILGRRPEKRAQSYDIELTDQGKNLIGRLKITAGITRGRAFNLETLYENIQVSEILKEPYSGEVFCGYENVSKKFSMLEVIFKNERQDWKTALENVKGIYVIADQKTGKKYVGKASGNDGVWSRWNTYMQTGHGWNKELIGLLDNADSEYARNNFRITLIECWPFKTDDKIIDNRERFWKEALLTKGEYGYNGN